MNTVIAQLRPRAGLLYNFRHAQAASAPDDWTQPRSVARWLFGVTLKRDGRTDGEQRAREIIPASGRTQLVKDGSLGLHDLVTVRERASLSMAMWEAWSGPLQWDEARIAEGFGMAREDIEPTLAFVAAEIRVGITKECRAGITDVRAIVRQALAGMAA